LYTLGLRRAEAVGLDIADVDLAGGAVLVLGKGPLFVALDRASKGHRLTGSAVYGIVRRLGEAAGVRARPHGLRHAAISRLLDLTNGNVRAVQKFSRHASVQTVLRYDDNRADAGGGLARRLAEDR
jgi:integrase/recombinase XerC